MSPSYRQMIPWTCLLQILGGDVVNTLGLAAASMCRLAAPAKMWHAVSAHGPSPQSRGRCPAGFLPLPAEFSTAGAP